MTTLSAGTRIELRGTPMCGGFPGVAPELATIARWTKISGPRMDGWHVVKFHTGGSRCIHESSFRVVDNRS